MLTILTAAALAAAAQQAPAPSSAPHAQHGQMGQVNHSQMDHSTMGQAKGQHSEGCCRKTADGKMECTMMKKSGAPSGHQGHLGR